MRINWVTVDDGGSPPITFEIVIRKSDGVTYSTELNYCDGTDTGIVAATTCSIPVTILRAAPFNLPWGSSVWAKIRSTNLYGNSEFSNFGNGAVITTNPDPPTSLAEDETQRDSTTLAFTW